ncbi:N-acetylneuraminate synthase [Chitinophaga agri]|uniref:N-acetylneuraminate synthase n=1 Tax=Chitinophaga agri TaxID=2703787 RepID=A0A6B9ZHV8_9BACT|nr:N-acetylneuraminate synthase [Chitinophaga agri]QHS61990.1 N-acetylneuraminate synthase [Chitinophaga agri]
MDRIFIIAEAGVNHNGDMSLAKQLIDIAADAKADAVKFQTFVAEKLVSKFAEKAAYQKASTDAAETQLSMIKKLELSFAQFGELRDYAEAKGIMFLSTPFDFPSIDFLKSLGMNYGKIPSGELTNLPYLIQMAKNFEHLILSTGMSEMSEIEDALKVLQEYGAKRENIVVLHCNTEYPTPFEDANLKAMLSIEKEFGIKVGYSDHTSGIEAAVAAAALGASVIEKHYTIDRTMEGPDHSASLEPQELKALVSAVRNIEKAMGTGFKTPSPSELKNKAIARKSVVAARDIKAGEVFTEDNLTIKRPGSGISPMKWFDVLGKKAIKDFQTDELITL